jgi:hypothetical protein
VSPRPEDRGIASRDLVEPRASVPPHAFEYVAGGPEQALTQRRDLTRELPDRSEQFRVRQRSLPVPSSLALDMLEVPTR